MPLEKIFTDPATAKILNVLWEYQDMDLTLTDVADEAGIHYTTLMKALPLLEELNMVYDQAGGECQVVSNKQG